jgi:arginine:agmatine antiporter
METNEGRVTGKSLGVAACTAIVVGNMVGSGFYLSPAAVAPFGNLAILAWIVMGAGAVCLGLTFAKLARLVPATGGPYAYTRMAYGDLPGFLIAWDTGFIWTSLLAIAIAFAGAIFDLVPALHNRIDGGRAYAWSYLGSRPGQSAGVKAAGMFSQVTTYSEAHPFAAIALFGLFFIDTSHFSELNLKR